MTDFHIIFLMLKNISLFFSFNSEFHYGPDKSEQSEDTAANEIDTGEVKVPSTPPKSSFQKLAPSESRYTLLPKKDEL